MKYENYDQCKQRHAQMNIDAMSIEELVKAHAEAISAKVSIAELKLRNPTESVETFFWDVMIANIKKSLVNQGYDPNNLVTEEYLRSQTTGSYSWTQDFYNMAQDISDFIKSTPQAAKPKPQPIDLKKLTQKELADLLKAFLVNVDKNLPKIREIFMHLTWTNLSIIRNQLKKNPDKYEKAITTLDAITRTKFG